MKTNKTETRILDLVSRSNGCTHEGLLSCDTGLAVSTIKRYTKRLLKAGRIQRTWDGVGLELTDAEISDREFECKADTLLPVTK